MLYRETLDIKRDMQHVQRCVTIALEAQQNVLVFAPEGLAFKKFHIYSSQSASSAIDTIALLGFDEEQTPALSGNNGPVITLQYHTPNYIEFTDVCPYVLNIKTGSQIARITIFVDEYGCKGDWADGEELISPFKILAGGEITVQTAPASQNIQTVEPAEKFDSVSHETMTIEKEVLIDG